MLRWICSFCLFVCAAAHAAPTPGQDEDMERMLADKGLISRIGGQIEHVRQTVGEKASGLVVNAMGFLGVPYKRGGTSVETGFRLQRFCSCHVRADQSVSYCRDGPTSRLRRRRSSIGPISSPVIWSSSTPCAGLSAMSASTSAMASSFTRHVRARKFAWTTCAPRTGKPASMAHVASLSPTRLPNSHRAFPVYCHRFAPKVFPCHRQGQHLTGLINGHRRCID